MLCISSALFGQGNAYKRKAEQKAVKFAYEILKVYYPSNQICVSDSIYNGLPWFLFLDYVDEETKKELMSGKILPDNRHTCPVYSKKLASLFVNYNSNCNDYKYVADFSGPYRGMIMCEILPKDRKIGIHGAPRIQEFLFKYDETGEINQVIRIEVDVD